MARVSISVALLLLARPVFSEALGRFGASESPLVAGFTLNGSGFKANAQGSERFGFAKAVTWKRAAASQEHALYKCQPLAGNPQAVRVNLRAPGFEMYCPYGLQLSVHSLIAPNLTVKGATFGPETPAPAERWVLLTFSDRQPPILLSFLDKSTETMVVGSSGDWKVILGRNFKGWVRISLPFGLEPMSANSVATLGNLALSLAKIEKPAVQKAPVVKSRSFETTDHSVIVTWQFDKPWSLVPPAFVLAKAGGYQVKTLSPVFDTGKGTEEGPLVFCTTPELKVELPLSRIPAGRSVSIGESRYVPPTVLPASLESTVELALANLIGSRSRQVVEASERALEEYYSHSSPASAQTTANALYLSDGSGLDLMAATALLTESMAMTEGQSVRSVTLLEPISGRIDPMTLLVSPLTAEKSRRAACLAAVAATLDTEPQSQGLGALLQVGLSAQEARVTYCKNRGIEYAGLPQSSPLWDLRKDLFGLTKGPAASDLFARALRSDVRVVSPQPVGVSLIGADQMLTWTHESGDKSQILLMSSSPIELQPVSNLIDLSIRESFGVYVVHYAVKGPGLCQAKINRPSWSDPFPLSVPVPRYLENPLPSLH